MSDIINNLAGLNVTVDYDIVRNGFCGFVEDKTRPMQKRFICGPYRLKEECLKAIRLYFDAVKRESK